MRAFPHLPIILSMQALLAASAHAGDVVKVAIGDLVFTPAEITVRAGDTVEWTNADFVDHTATAKSGEWDVLIPAGKSGRVELSLPGTVAYYCRYHPGMTGTIHVIAADPR